MRSSGRRVLWRTCVALSAAIAARAGGEARADCNDPFGKPNEVLDFHVRMKRADWNTLVASTVPNFDSMPLDSPACMAQFPEFPAEFRCGTTEPWLKVGVRKKRGTERGVEAPQKPPLKIDINEDFMGQQPTAKGQRWPASFGELGYRKLTLNNGQSNKPPDGRTLLLPVLLQEHVALRLLKREIPATPGTAYAKVTLHFEDKPDGEYHGVHVLVEDVDRTGVRRRWPSAVGRLLKQSKSNCSPEVEYDDGPPNAAAAAFDAWIKKNPASFPGTWLAESSKGVDMDTLLRQEAIREIIVNGDDTLMYSAHRALQGNNWYAFDPMQGGLRQYMPWDVDLTFGQQYTNCQPTPLKCPPTTPLIKFCATSKSIVGQLTVCQTEIQKRYLEIMCQLTKGSMSSAEMLKVWEAAYATVAPVVPLEKDTIWGGMDPSSPSIDKSFGAEYVRLKAWIPERVRSVQQQITMRGIACSPGCTAGAKEACQYLGCASERRCENNLWTPCLPVANCGLPARDAGATDGGRSDGGATDGARGDGAAGGAGGGTSTGGAGGGAGGGTSTGGAGGSDPRNPPRRDPGAGGGAAAASGEAPSAQSAGCACTVGEASPTNSSGALLAIASAVMIWWRRRRSRSALGAPDQIPRLVRPRGHE